ncbi:MAG: hypothetical protein ACYTGN_05425 [Planctomycetota bacterium]|jgi:hypothetical protein
MKKRHVCHHCGEHYPAGRANCPHCGADRDFTHAEDPAEFALPEAMDDAAYEDFLAGEGLKKRRSGCAGALLLALVPIWWILL